MIDKQFEDLPEQYKKDIEFTGKVYNATPTKDAPNGTKGRMAVVEMYEMDKDLEAVILKNASEVDIAKVVRQKGMLTMKQDAIVKAMHKLIPFEQVNTL